MDCQRGTRAMGPRRREALGRRAPTAHRWRSGKAVPAELRELAPDVNWRGLARLRDFLAHAYYAVDADELWNICTAHAPADLERLRVLLALQSGDHGSD